MYLLEFNSADDYALIKEGETYKVYGYWFRFPLLSWLQESTNMKRFRMILYIISFDNI